IAGSFTGFRVKTATEPALDKFHVSIDSCLRSLHQSGRFLGGAAKKVAYLHKLNLVRVDGIQLIQCPIQFEEVLAANVYPWKVIAQRDADASASPHLCLISTSVVDKYPAHHLGCECVEMPPVFVRDFLLVQQLQVEFVHESRCLQHIGISLPANVRRGDLTQVGIDKWHELLEDRVLAISPLRQ